MTLTVYVACFASEADVEAKRDDPSCDLDMMAAPQFSHMSMNHTRDWVDGIKDDAEDEWAYFLEENEDTIEWDDGEWVTPEHGRRNRTLVARLNNEIVGQVVIQAMQMET